MTARFGLRVVIPVVAVLVGALVIVVISLSEMASEVNLIESRLTTRSVEAALGVTIRNVEQTHRDYAKWDDAVRHAYGAVDQAFMQDTYAASTTTPDHMLFDTAVLIDETGHVRFAVHRGEAVPGDPEAIFGPSFAAMVRPLVLDGVTYDVRSGFLATRWGIAAVSAGSIVPFNKDFKPRPGRSRILVLARVLDPEVVEGLQRDFLIDDLRLVPADAALDHMLPVDDFTGKTIGALAWSPPSLGDQARSKVSPTVFTMLTLVGLTMAFLIAIALRGMQEVERRDAEAHHAATHDALSGLPNRAAIVAALDEAIAARKREGTPVTVVFLDIDGFKEVNDAFGHEIGDRLLKEVARNFRERVTDHLIARVGGDEFAVVVSGPGAVKTACDLGWRLISSVTDVFEIDGRMIAIGASVGVAVADDSTPSAEELLRRADVAMAQAKQQGRSRLFVYDAVIDTVRHERLEIAGDLRRAIRDGGLTVAYQPIFDAGTRAIIGVEALIRWDRPQLGPLPPAVFVPIAEQSGLIDELGEWTIRRACLDALAWPSIKVSVNVSPAQLRKPNFENQLTAILRETGFPVSRLDLEVTESYFIANSDQARRAIDVIRGLGISVSLDDFGTGYSSIGYLRSFNFDKLKLDRSLIIGLARDERVLRLVEATIALAGALDLEVTAEGVETEVEATLLQNAGCVAFQGFFFAKPMPAPAIAALIRSLGVAGQPSPQPGSGRHAQLGHPG
ncbi:MAG: bifunctional diguanylate cyclase/phosphodiesterase [Rhizobiales bacterium]|nr:bifunctional diguanylate cyclase/phosphodiesterase [Hyphomicrobiales bacterium]